MIPKIIHQIWEGEVFPEFLAELASTWKLQHPDWQYEFWNEDRMILFLRENFPEFIDLYMNYPYSVQRWDAVRYFFLYKMGGLYVDMDYECIEPFDQLLHGKNCCFGMDPEQHADIFRKPYIITNAMMASVPHHPFFKHIIDLLPKTASSSANKFYQVLETTGPFFLTQAYDLYPEKDGIYLFPAEYTSPLTQNEIRQYRCGALGDEQIEPKLEKAVAIHYFFGSWYNKA